MGRLEILIVDDEPKQRRGLAAMVRSLRPNYRICEAKNGKDALELAISRKLDIVFTDIQMPVVNGLEFVEAMMTNERMHSPKIIFVSVYHEFQYAQKALRLGAKDYLVKPVRPENMEEILVELEKQIEEERSRSMEKQQLAEQLAHTIPVYQEHLLYKWLTEGVSASEQKEVRQWLTLQGRGTVVILRTRLRVEKLSVETPSAAEAEWELILKKAIHRSMEEEANLLLLSPREEKSKLFLVLQWKEGVDSKQALERLHTELAQLEEIYNSTIAAGIACEESMIEVHRSRSLDSANRAFERLYYYPDNAWLSADDIGCSQGSTAAAAAAGSPSISAKDAEELEEAVVRGDADSAVARAAALLDRAASLYPSPFRLRCSIIQLLLACLKRVEPAMEEGIHHQLRERLDQEIMKAESFKETRSVAISLLTGMIGQTKKDKGSRTERIMQKCGEYVEANLHEELGLELLAQRFFYNPSYFSILFKNHFGLSFTDYLAKVRMQKARGLLLQSELKVAEIAKQVGFKDIKYFNKVFKKMFLYPPEEFRRLFANMRTE